MATNPIPPFPPNRFPMAETIHVVVEIVAVVAVVVGTTVLAQQGLSLRLLNLSSKAGVLLVKVLDREQRWQDVC